MEAFDRDSNCPSVNEFSLYEHYMRSFHPDQYFGHSDNRQEHTPRVYNELVLTNGENNLVYTPNAEDSAYAIDLNVMQTSESNAKQTNEQTEDDNDLQLDNIPNSEALVSKENSSSCDREIYEKKDYEAQCLSENSLGGHNDNSLKSQIENLPLDLPVSSDDTKSDSSSHPKPVMITSLITMENSNNAVDSGRLFSKVATTETNVFKLPINELSFNGTLKHIQKLKPIVDPITALSSNVYCNEVVSDNGVCNENNDTSSQSKGQNTTSMNYSSDTPSSSNDSNNAVQNIQSDSNNVNIDDNKCNNVGIDGNCVNDDLANVQNDSKLEIENTSDSTTLETKPCMKETEDCNCGKNSCICGEDTNSKSSYDNSKNSCDNSLSGYEHSKSSFENSKTSYYRKKACQDNANESSKACCWGHSKEAQSKDSFRWALDQSDSSMDAYTSAPPSPEIFSDNEECHEVKEQQAKNEFWDFMKKHEYLDKVIVKKMEKTLQGVPPPPSVTILQTDVKDMLKKYYCFLPLFNEVQNQSSLSTQPETPSKRTSFVKIPTDTILLDTSCAKGRDNSPIKNRENTEKPNDLMEKTAENISKLNEKVIPQTDNSQKAQESLNASFCVDNINIFGMNGTEKTEMGSLDNAKDMLWPDVMKCRFHDVHYNLTAWSEKREALALRCGLRYVGAETASTVTVFSSSVSPTSAQKRKALRVKMCQAKSPGRRLSHLARRRQAFCSAATLADKSNPTNSKMVLIDKNYFPHRKLTYTTDRKSPRVRKTPGRKTPGRKTPGKKTPRKTPGKKAANSSSKKKAARRLNLDEIGTKSQPTRETSKRALFLSPEDRKLLKAQEKAVTTVPRGIKSKRALFGSPNETKSLDGTPSNSKRKWDELEGPSTSGYRSKLQKSLSFGGDAFGGSTSAQVLTRRATEVFGQKSVAELNGLHKKKLLWAVSEALRAHGWRMGAPGFREKASALAHLTRRLLALPAHAARYSAPHASTSDSMLRLARQYVFAIIQGRSVEECYLEEQIKLNNEANSRIKGYVSAATYQQLKTKANIATSSKIKENTCDSSQIKQDLPKTANKNILQDKLLNIDSNSNSSSSIGISMSENTALFKSNSMPSFRDAAKLRARRQISFDNVEEPPKR